MPSRETFSLGQIHNLEKTLNVFEVLLLLLLVLVLVLVLVLQ